MQRPPPRYDDICPYAPPAMPSGRCSDRRACSRAIDSDELMSCVFRRQIESFRPTDYAAAASAILDAITAFARQITLIRRQLVSLVDAATFLLSIAGKNLMLAEAGRHIRL